MVGPQIGVVRARIPQRLSLTWTTLWAGGPGPGKFAEPVTLSSATPAGFPLARTALGCGFDLLALRARRNRHATKRPYSAQGVWTVRPQRASFSRRFQQRPARLWTHVGDNPREHVLILFRAAHEACVDSLIERHLVLLGVGLAAALALAADDPYFAHSVFEPVAVEWKLV